jgi:hypothetical protein
VLNRRCTGDGESPSGAIVVSLEDDRFHLDTPLECTQHQPNEGRREPASTVIVGNTTSTKDAPMQLTRHHVITIAAAAVLAVSLAACTDGSEHEATATSAGSAASAAEIPATTQPRSTAPQPSPSSTPGIPARLLPAPTGEYAVGVNDAGKLGSSTVRIWYPAIADTGSTAAYLTPAAAADLGVSADAVPELTPGARMGATPADGADPLVILTAGWGSRISVSTVVAEDLASAGFVVIGLDPTPGSENEAIIPGEAEAAIRIADIRAAIDFASRSTVAELAGEVDTSRIIVGGHSYGGATAFEASFLDQRIDAVFDLDGSLFRRAASEGPAVPALTICGRDVCGQAAAAGHQDHASVIELASAEHLDFTDVPFITTVLGRLGFDYPVGPAGKDVTTSTAQILQRFVTAVAAGQPPASSAELITGIENATIVL